MNKEQKNFQLFEFWIPVVVFTVAHFCMELIAWSRAMATPEFQILWPWKILSFPLFTITNLLPASFSTGSILVVLLPINSLIWGFVIVLILKRFYKAS